MAVRLFGVETEAPYTPVREGRRRGREDDPSDMVELIIGQVRHVLPCVGTEQGNTWMANGGRLYSDCGHPEICTPECSSPKELVRFIKGNELILKRAAKRVVESRDELAAIQLFRNNVNYSRDANSWGTHESYMYRSRMDKDILIAHLATRIIFSGGGGFNPSTREGAGIRRFTLSPRVWSLQGESSGDTMSERCIFNERSESLTGVSGYKRLHVICGESNCSDLSSYLKLGSTALVTALVDTGRIRRRGNLTIVNPLQEMQKLAYDVTCRHPFTMEDRSTLSAIGIQRRLLELVRSQMDDTDFFPDWTEEFCEDWQSILHLLDGAPDTVNTRLDWAIKFKLFRDYLKREDLGHKLLTNQFGGAYIQQLSSKLCALDLQFGRYDETGVYDAINQSGALLTGVEGIDDGESTLETGPEFGRAKLRAKYIREWSGASRVSTGWQFVHNRDTDQYVDLNDPLVEEVVVESRDRSRNRSRERRLAPAHVQPTMQSTPSPRLRGRWVQTALANTRSPQQVTPADPELAEEFSVGDVVTLGRHESMNDSLNWNESMDEHVGELTQIVTMLGPDWGGCLCASVAIDNGEYSWRLRNMIRTVEVTSDETSDQTES